MEMIRSMRISLIIPAAGIGRRMKAEINKQYLQVAGKPILAHTIEKFHEIGEIEEIIIVAAEDEIDFCRIQVAEKYNFTKVKSIVAGGKTRQESVHNGFKKVSPEIDYVIIHDGVRPFVTVEQIKDFIKELKDVDALVMGVPEKNTIKKIKDSFIIKTIDREDVWEIQTPQGFRREVLGEAFTKVSGNYHLYTDDSSMVEELKLPVKIFQGDYLNIKITVPEDLRLGKAILEMQEEDG